MIRVEHRRNTLAALRATPRDHGVEIDVRSVGSALVLQHDPYVGGEALEAWLPYYHHRLLILNVKEDGLEPRLLELMAQHGIADFFFLDQAFPSLVRCARAGESRCAVRVSELESVETALRLGGQVDWVWVDSFERFPLRREHAEQLRAAKLRLCVVSPELQGRADPSEIATLRATLAQEGITPEAVCTKTPGLWT